MASQVGNLVSPSVRHRQSKNTHIFITFSHILNFQITAASCHWFKLSSRKIIPVCADYWRSPSTRGSTWTASSCRWPAAVTSPQTSIHIMAKEWSPPPWITLKGQYRETRIYFHLSKQSSRVVTYHVNAFIFLINICLVWRSRRVREELSTFADTFGGILF
jgi:hypothetical protein